MADWIAAGIDPERAVVFVQSMVPEHAELHLLLSMITPLGWLERVPTYKDQIREIENRDLNTYGFLGYPLLQTADILVYRAHFGAGGGGPGQSPRARRARSRAGSTPSTARSSRSRRRS